MGLRTGIPPLEFVMLIRVFLLCSGIISALFPVLVSSAWGCHGAIQNCLIYYFQRLKKATYVLYLFAIKFFIYSTYFSEAVCIWVWERGGGGEREKCRGGEMLLPLLLRMNIFFLVLFYLFWYVFEETKRKYAVSVNYFKHSWLL